MQGEVGPKIPFTKVRNWLFGVFLPCWSTYGIDAEYGGFLEDLTFDGRPGPARSKRVRTMCRQTFAFSHAALHGFKPGAALSSLGYDYLLRHACLGDGAWAKTLTRRGAVRDPTPELYDLAFVIFALAWRYKLTAETETRHHLEQTLTFIERRLGAAEGFLSRQPDDGVRLQNPHMHLTEACLTAFEATQDERYLDSSRTLVDLFRRRLFDGRTLGERFGSDWSRLPSQTLEPGHHYEWAWILAQYSRVSGEQTALEVEALIEWPEAHGRHQASGAILDAVGESGQALKESSRVWPNAERIKGWLGLYELICRDPSAPVARTLHLLFERYFTLSTPGLWVDQIDGDCAALSKFVPASVVYHILLAFSEVLRLEERLR